MDAYNSNCGRRLFEFRRSCGGYCAIRYLVSIGSARRGGLLHLKFLFERSGRTFLDRDGRRQN